MSENNADDKRKKMLMIINPISGFGLGKVFRKKIRNEFRENGFQVSYIFTKSSEDAVNIARDNLDKYGYYTVCSGDGTLSQVINGVIGSDIKIMHIPIGTANVFAREWNIPTNFKKAIHKLLHGKEIKVDIAKSNNGYFFLMEGVGLDGYVVDRIENYKYRLGYIAYMVETTKAMFNYKNPALTVEVDGVKYTDVHYVLLSKIKKYGGVFRLTPEASMTNGVFDVLLVKKKGLFMILKLQLFGLFNKMKKLKDVLMLKGKKIKIYAAEEIKPFAQRDGNPSPELPHEIEILEKAVTFIVP